MFNDAFKKVQVWQQFTEINVGGTTRAQCNMYERDVPAGTALLDMGMCYGILRSRLGVDKA